MKLPLGLTPNQAEETQRQLRQRLRKVTIGGIFVWAVATGLMILVALGIVPYDVFNLNR